MQLTSREVAMSRPVRPDPRILQITEQEILADLSWPFRLPGDWTVEPTRTARAVTADRQLRRTGN
jgi:hypothetical protein